MNESFSYQLNNEANIPFLRELAGKKGAFIEKITDTMHIGLLPSTLGKLKSGILDNLNNMLRKYDPQLDGILVGYDNLAMLGSNGHMIPGYHHIHINIRADFYVFKPVVGGTLTGTVLKKSGASATCLTNKVFTVFVAFPPHLKHCLHKVQLHQEISFTIEKVDLLCQIPFVKGVLNEDRQILSSAGSHVRFDSLEPDSGLSSIEESSLGRSPTGTSGSADLPDTPRSSKHKRRRDPMPEPDGEPTASEEPWPRRSRKRRREEEQEQEQTSPRKVKKEKKDPPSGEEGGQEELHLDDPEPPANSHKKKKKKRDRPELNGSVSGMLR